MRKKRVFVLALLLAAAAVAACADELPEMRASLRYDGDGGVSARVAFTPTEPLYVVTGYFRFGGEALTVSQSNTEGHWAQPGAETTLVLDSEAVPQKEWPFYEALLIFLAPEKGTRQIEVNSPDALSEIDAALAAGLTPVGAEEPHPVLVGSDWLLDSEMEELTEEDGPLYVPMIGAANSVLDAAAELTEYCNLRVKGRRKLSFDFVEEETLNGPVLVTPWRVVPVALSLADGEAAMLTAIEDEAETAVSPEKAAEIAALALAEQYELPASEFAYLEGDVMLLHPPEGPEDVWVVNLMDAGTGEATDHTAQVDAATGEILWIAGPGEGNG